MKSSRNKMRAFWNDLPAWAQVALVLAVVALISFMFPTGVKFAYTYGQGQRWRYDDLFAPFDFPIRKTNEQLAAERRAVLEARDPYLLANPEVAAEELASFEAEFQRQFQGLADSSGFRDLKRRPNFYLERGRGLIERAYERGIVQRSPSFEAPPNGIVHVVRGGKILERAPTQLVDAPAVVQRLRDSLQQMRLSDADFLLPLVEDAIRPNIQYSDSLTNRFAQAQLEGLVEAQGMVQQGELIIAESGIVTEETVRKLDSYKLQYESEVIDRSRGWLMYLGYLLLTCMIMAVLLLYIRLFHRQEFKQFSRLMFILVLVLVASFAVFRIDSINSLSVYLMPFAIVPIVIKNFYPPGVALFTHLVIVLIASFLSSLGYEFTFLQIVAGIVAVLSPTGPRDWSKILRSMVLLAITYLLGYIGLELIKQGNWRAIDWTVLTWLALNVFLTLLAYPLVPLLGRLFGFISDVVLLELSDVNRETLRELSLKAPGTFQHSLAVSNLSEAATREIGGDTLLVKVAALYHDIGKTVDPLYFIENQGGRNPHDDLTELESAQVIINHVDQGLRLAKKAGLPAVIIDFIATHHGTTRVEYFYRTYAAKHPDVDDSKFRYPGPLPQTREQGVMMIADSLEAAARALKDPTAADIDALVDGIIEHKVSLGQLNDCALSFKELRACRGLFKSMLKSMYHARVEYPNAPEPSSKAVADAVTERSPGYNERG